MMNPEKTAVLGGQAQSVGNAGAPGKLGAASAASTEAAGAAFRALLERLEKTAQDLDAASDSIDDPRELGQVVENARASVEEAVLMGSDLLEAYRAAQARATSSSPSTNSTESPTDRPRTGHGEAR